MRGIVGIELVGGPLDGQSVAIEEGRREYPIALDQRAGTAPLHIPEGVIPKFPIAFYRPKPDDFSPRTFYWEATNG